MGEIRSVVKQVLSQLGTSREARYYLNQYSEDSLHFAVVKVGGALIENQLESLASALAFLRNLGLMPIILHGAGPQLDAALASADVPTVKHEGLRVTTPEVMEIARPVIYRANRQIVTALENQGVRAQGIQHGVFECDFLGKRKFGLVGKVSSVHTTSIKAAIKVKSIPVIASLGETAGGQILNVNADWAANELVKKLKRYKIIFLTGMGGLLDGDGELIDSINLSTEYDELMHQPWLHSGMKLKMEQIERTEAELAVTTCANCRQTFDDGQAHFKWDHKMHSLLELVADNLLEDAS